MVQNKSSDFTYEGKELDWNSEISASTYFDYIPGEYEFEVIDFQRGTHPGSAKLPPCPKAILKLRVYFRSGSSTEVSKHLFLHSKMEGLLTGFFISIGLMEKGENLKMNWDDVVGRRGRAIFYNREADNGKKYFEVKQFLPHKNNAASSGGF